jgi:hypothetical protein
MMQAEDLDATLASLMDAGDALEGLDDEHLPPELQKCLASLQARIHSLVAYTESFQSRMAEHSTVRTVHAVRLPSAVQRDAEEADLR